VKGQSEKQRRGSEVLHVVMTEKMEGGGSSEETETLLDLRLERGTKEMKKAQRTDIRRAEVKSPFSLNYCIVATMTTVRQVCDHMTPNI